LRVVKGNAFFYRKSKTNLANLFGIIEGDKERLGLFEKVQLIFFFQFNEIASTFKWLDRYIATGGSLTRLHSQSPCRNKMANK